MVQLKDLVNTMGNEEEIKKLLTDRAKKDIMTWIDVKVLPTAKETIDKVNAELQKQAKDETGWCKIRDMFFIPAVLSIIVWFFTVADELIKNNTTEEKE